MSSESYIQWRDPSKGPSNIDNLEILSGIYDGRPESGHFQIPFPENQGGLLILWHQVGEEKKTWRFCF